MNFKKMKRLLSVVLSATMILSSNMTGLAAEIAADPTAPAEESQIQEPTEHEHQWQLVEDLKGIERYACMVEGCTETKNEVAPIADEMDKGDDTIQEDPMDVDENQSAAPNETDSNNENETKVGTCPSESHAVVAVPRQAPTCLEKGRASYYTCNICNVKYRTRTDAQNQTNPIPADQEDAVLGIEKSDHRAVEVPKQEATCTQDGVELCYTCPICGEYYETIEKLYADATGARTNLAERPTIKAAGHVYKNSEDTSTIAFNWDDFSFTDYIAGDANGVTASRKCIYENCDTVGGYVQQAKNVAVTKTEPDPSFDCATGGENNVVIYTAVATFEEDPSNPSAVGTPVTEQQEKSMPVSEHAYTYVLTWEDSLIMNEQGKLAYDTSKISGVRTCNICGKDPADAAPVEVDVELTEDGMSDADYTLKCSAEGPFEFTATATVGNDIVKTETKDLMLPIGRHNLNWTEGSEPTCSNPGSYAHFICTNSGCGNRYWDEASAQNGDTPLTDEDINRPKLGHNFMNPTFEFQTYPAAVAKFNCRRGDITVIKECEVDLENGNWQTEQPNANCGDEVNMTYSASVLFDGNTVKQTDGVWMDDPDADGYAPMKYPGSVVQNNVTLKHNYQLVADSLAWIDQPAAGSYVDPTKGVTATLKCEQCQSEVVFKNENGQTTVTAGGSNDPTIVTTINDPALTYTLDENESTAATCQDEGTSVYNITITGTALATETASSSINITEQTLELTTAASGHKYVIDGDPVEGTAGTNGAPVISTMTIKCAVEGCDFAPISYDSSTSNNVTVSMTKETTAGQNGYTPATCTDDGNIVWVADIEVTDGNNKTGKVFKSYDTSWNGTPWTKVETDGAKGHDYSDAPVFDWSEYGEVTEDTSGNKTIKPYDGEHQVYAVYTCKSTECTHVADASETPAVDGTTYDTVNNKRVKKVVANVTATPVTDCGSATSRTHTATLTDNTQTYTETATEAISGHDWNALEWGAWVVDSTTPTITVTVGDKQKEIPNYIVSASRTCKICNTTEDLSTPLDSNGKGIEITPQTDAETCTTAGSTIYWAKAIITPADSVSGTEEVAEDCRTPYVHIYNATGHTYNINWTWYGKLKNKEYTDEYGEVITSLNQADVLKYTKATVTKVCAANDKTIPLDDTYGTSGISFVPPTNKLSCKETGTYNYTASARFADDPGENGDVYTETRKIIHMKKDSHNYEWTLTNWDPQAETVTVTALCQDDDNTFTVQNVALTVTSEDSADATCVSGAKELVTGTFSVNDSTDNNKEYKAIGTYSKADNNIDEDAHDFAPAVIDWSNPLEGGTVDKEAGTVTYTVTAQAACTLDNTTDKSHTQDVTVTAVAELTDVEKICCVEDYEITYNLSMSEADAETYTLADGDKKVYTHAKEASHGKMERKPAVEGNCVTAGHSAYYECPKCHKRYSDVSGNNEYTDDVEAPLGHRYGNPTYFWNVDGEKVSARFTCNRAGCQESYEGHTRTFVAEVDKTADGDPVNYTETEATCVDAPDAHDGLDYYMVTVKLPDTVNQEEFTNTEYHGDVPVTVPIGDHVADEENNPEVCKFCGKKLADQVKVIFRTAAGADFVTERFAVGTAAADIAAKVPEGPNRSGYTFEGWSLVADSTAAAADISTDIAAKIATNDTGKPLADVIVYPVYAEKVAKGKIIAEYVKETKTGETVTLTPIEGQANTEKEGNVGSRVDITAEEVTDLVFSYWAEVNADGAIVVLSTNTVYSMFITSEASKTIKAVFVASEEDKKDAAPTVAMTDKYATGTAEDTVHKISFVVTVDVPETCTVVESGILYSTDAATGSNPSAMIAGSTNTKVKKFVFANENRTNILTMNVGTNPANWGKDIYARGYVIYTESGSPDQKVAYSIIDSDNYNNLLSK